MRGEFGNGGWGFEMGESYFRDCHLPDGEEGIGDMDGEQFGENVNLEQDLADSIMSKWRSLLGNSGEILGGQPGDLGGEAGSMVLG